MTSLKLKDFVETMKLSRTLVGTVVMHSGSENSSSNILRHRVQTSSGAPHSLLEPLTAFCSMGNGGSFLGCKTAGA